MGDEYVKEGIKISPDILIAGNNVEIQYTGLLACSGANRVYMHWGYQDRWKFSDTIEMKKIDNTFRAVVNIASNGQIHVAFEDDTNNWDNNSGENYTFKVH